MNLKFWRVPHLGNLELLDASNITHVYPSHIHEHVSIGVMLHGVETITCRGASHTALPGDVLVINADETHSDEAVRSAYRVMKIEPKIVSEIAGAAFFFPKPVLRDKLVFSSLQNLFLKLEERASHLEQESELISAIAMLAARLNKTEERTGKERRSVQAVRDYLKAHSAENTSLAQLTSITNLSRFHLLRVFREEVGVPPHEYQTQVRIAHARKLIRHGRSIAAAALETGFFDQSHLSRNFKRIVGMTPGQYWSQSKIVQERDA